MQFDYVRDKMRTFFFLFCSLSFSHSIRLNLSITPLCMYHIRIVIIAGPNVQCMRARVSVAASLCMFRYMSVPESLCLGVCANIYECIQSLQREYEKISASILIYKFIGIWNIINTVNTNEWMRIIINIETIYIYAYEEEARSHIHRYTHECDKGIVASHTRRSKWVCMVVLSANARKHVCIRRSNKIFFSSFPYNIYYVESIITFCVYCLHLLLPLFFPFSFLWFFFHRVLKLFISMSVERMNRETFVCLTFCCCAGGFWFFALCLAVYLIITSSIPFTLNSCIAFFYAVHFVNR